VNNSATGATAFSKPQSTRLLLQKAAHDIDLLHWLCGGFTDRVVGMGGLTVYNEVQRRLTELGPGQSVQEITADPVQSLAFHANLNR
jgi:predicted dehydrogenase